MFSENSYFEDSQKRRWLDCFRDSYYQKKAWVGVISILVNSVFVVLGVIIFLEMGVRFEGKVNLQPVWIKVVGCLVAGSGLIPLLFFSSWKRKFQLIHALAAKRSLDHYLDQR